MSDEEITSASMRHLAERNIRKELIEKKTDQFFRAIKHQATHGETEVIVGISDLRTAEQRYIRKQIEGRGFKVLPFANDWTITW